MFSCRTKGFCPSCHAKRVFFKFNCLLPDSESRGRIYCWPRGQDGISR